MLTQTGLETRYTIMIEYFFSCLAGLQRSGLNAQDETRFTFNISIIPIIPLICCVT